MPVQLPAVPAEPSVVPDLLADLLADLAVYRPVARGEAIFRHGARSRHVYHLRRGRVLLHRFGPAGEEVIIHAAAAGEFFAEASLHSDRYHCTAVAAADGEVGAIDAAALRQRLRTDPQFALQWVERLSQQLREVRARVERLSLKSASERVRHLLVTRGRGTPPRLQVEGTLRQLAPELGLTHEALYRTLAAMQRDGRVERRAGSIVLLR